jgi:hypothetical protein
MVSKFQAKVNALVAEGIIDSLGGSWLGVWLALELLSSIACDCGFAFD